VTVTNAGGASLTCPDDIVVQFFDETVPSPDPNLLLVSNLCPPVFKNWLGDSAPQSNGCTNIIFRSYEASNACGVRLICTQRIHIRIPPVVLEPFPASVTQTFQPDGVHMTVCAAVQGTGPFNYSWFTNGNFAFTTDTSCATFVFSPIEENLRVSVRVGNNCGGGSSGGSVTTPCSVCLSRGAPNVLSRTTGSDTGPSLLNQPPNCTVGATARWFKTIADDTGLITISTEGPAIDTVLAVYTGPIGSPDNLTRIACNDNISSSNLQSRVRFQATMGTVYWVIVDRRTTSTALKLTYGFEPKIASFSFSSNRVFQLTSSIAPAIRYRVEAAGIFSTNSSNWTTVLVTNLTTTYPYVFFRETNAPSIHRRFYRLAPTY